MARDLIYFHGNNSDSDISGSNLMVPGCVKTQQIDASEQATSVELSRQELISLSISARCQATGATRRARIESLCVCDRPCRFLPADGSRAELSMRPHSTVRALKRLGNRQPPGSDPGPKRARKYRNNSNSCRQTRPKVVESNRASQSVSTEKSDAESHGFFLGSS